MHEGVKMSLKSVTPSEQPMQKNAQKYGGSIIIVPVAAAANMQVGALQVTSETGLLCDPAQFVWA